MKTYFLLLLVIILFGTSCRKILYGPDDVLSLSKQDYNGNELRLDGIYYAEFENFEGKIYQKYALYRNGVIRDLGGSKEIDVPKNLLKNYKTDWGVFQINNGEIKFERWYPSSGAELAYIRSGVILNDSTFRITESYRNQKGQKTEVRERDEVYHFKAFTPKPDSTNSFIN